MTVLGIVGIAQMVSVQAWIRKAVNQTKQNEQASLFEQIFTVISLILYLDAMFGVMFADFSATVTRLLFLGSYAIVTGILLTRYRNRLLALLPRSGSLWIVALLPVLSTLWSDYPAVAFPRGLAVFQASLFGLYLGLRFSLPALLNLLGYILMGLLGGSLLALAGLSWWEGDAGVFANTDAFGLRMVLGAIVFLLLALESRMWRRRAWFLFVVSIVCAFLSGSAAARECAVVVLVSIPAIALPRWRNGPILTVFFYSISILSGCILFALVENAESLQGVLKLDSLFSSAIAAELEVVSAIQNRFLVGYGYESFWVGSVDGPSESLSQLASVAADTHLHSGILESMLNVGFLGTLCACICLWSALLYYFQAVRIRGSVFYFFPILFFCLFLFSNFTEYSFYARNNIFWVLFVSVLTLVADRSSRQTYSQTLLASARSQHRYNSGASLGTSPTSETGEEATASDATPVTLAATVTPQERTNADLGIPNFSGSTSSGPPSAAVLSLDSPDPNLSDFARTGQAGNEPAARELDALEPDNFDEFPLEVEEDWMSEMAPGGELQNVNDSASKDEFSQPATEVVPLASPEPIEGEAIEGGPAIDGATDSLRGEDDTIPNEASMSEIEPAEEFASTVAFPMEKGLKAASDWNADGSLTSSSDLAGSDLDFDDVSAVVSVGEVAADASVDFNSSLDSDSDIDSDSDAGLSIPELVPTPDLDTSAGGETAASPSVETSPDTEIGHTEVWLESKPTLNPAGTDIDEISEADTEPALQEQSDLELQADLVSEVVRDTDAQPTVVLSNSNAEATLQVRTGSNVSELLLATHWLDTLEPDWIGEERPSVEENDLQATRPPANDTGARPSSKFQVPTLLVNESLLKVHNLEFEVDSSAPLFRRLEAAELMNVAQLASVQTLWQQEGGQIATILQQETGLGMATLNFFSDSLWSRHLARRKRIGEYLQEAELVSAHEVQSTIDTLQGKQQSIPLGVALAEQGIIRQTTADYFARSLVQRARPASDTDSPETKSPQIPKNIELTATRGGCSVCVVMLWGRLERRPRKQLRQSLFDAAELYSPNVLIDMTLVTSVDMPSLRAIVAAANRCRTLRGQLCLCGISTDVQLFLQNQSTQLGLRSFPNRFIAIENFPIL
ncbi:MAG: STAS domain-containing protein [Cyanobacteria bacterium P01_E01_bin.34]